MLCPKAAVPMVFLWFTACSGGFDFEKASPHKQSALNEEKEIMMGKIPQEEWKAITLDYCKKNGKFLAVGPNTPLKEISNPFADYFLPSASEAFLNDENWIRDTLARRFKFNNVYRLDYSREMEKIAFFIANLNLCFPTGNINFRDYTADARLRVTYMYVHPKKFGLMEHVPWNEERVPNVVSLKVAFYEDYVNLGSSHQLLIRVINDMLKVRNDVVSIVSNSLQLNKKWSAMYLNGFYNYTADPRKSGDENLDWENGMLYDKRVLAEHAGSHLVGYAFNGFLDVVTQGENCIELCSNYILRVQLVAVYAYVYWDIKNGKVDESYAGSPSGKCGDFYSSKNKSFEYKGFKKKGRLKGFQADRVFTNLCHAQYDDPGPNYKDYVDPDPDTDYRYPNIDGHSNIGNAYARERQCCYLCFILMALSALMTAAAILYNSQVKKERKNVKRLKKKRKKDKKRNKKSKK